MKKLYSLFILMLLLPAAAMAQTEYPFWVSAYNGSMEIYSDAAMTNKIIADYGSEDGTEADIAETAFPNGLYLKFIPDDGYILGSILINGTDFILNVENNTCHVTFDEIEYPEYGIDMIASFEYPHTLELLSTGPGTIKAFKDVDLTHEIESGGYITDSDFFFGFFIQVTPETGCSLQSLVVNNVDVTSEVENGIYIVRELNDDVTVSATFTESSAGIDLIDTDNNSQPTMLYDLNGRRISPDNAAGGIRIIRQGNKTSKILLKK